MDYCAAVDVQLYTQSGEYTVSTTPTLVDVGLMISQVSAEIDVALGRAGITSPTILQLLILKKYTALGVASFVEVALKNNAGTEYARPKFYRDEFQKFIDNPGKFLDAPITLVFDGSTAKEMFDIEDVEL